MWERNLDMERGGFTVPSVHYHNPKKRDEDNSWRDGWFLLHQGFPSLKYLGVLLWTLLVRVWYLDRRTGSWWLIVGFDFVELELKFIVKKIMNSMANFFYRTKTLVPWNYDIEVPAAAEETGRENATPVWRHWRHHAVLCQRGGESLNKDNYVLVCGSSNHTSI